MAAALRISFSRLCVWIILYADCIHISVSIFLHSEGLSMRSAISSDKPALPLSKLDSVGRETPKRRSHIGPNRVF
jgi:hypothetical protein